MSSAVPNVASIESASADSSAKRARAGSVTDSGESDDSDDFYSAEEEQQQPEPEPDDAAGYGFGSRTSSASSQSGPGSRSTSLLKMPSVPELKAMQAMEASARQMAQDATRLHESWLHREQAVTEAHVWLQSYADRDTRLIVDLRRMGDGVKDAARQLSMLEQELSGASVEQIESPLHGALRALEAFERDLVAMLPELRKPSRPEAASSSAPPSSQGAAASA